MIIKVETAEYIARVAIAIRDGVIDRATLTNTCPECGEHLGYFNTGEHITYDTSTDDDPENIAIIVACEGYWVVNPALVGIDKPNWLASGEMYNVVTDDGLHPGTPGAPTIVLDRGTVENRMGMDLNVSEHPTDDEGFNAGL